LKIVKRAFLAILAGCFASAARADPPTTDYRLIQMDGFNVFMSPDLSSDARLRNTTLNVLQLRLKEVQALVTPAQLVFFKSVSFWIQGRQGTGGATYHSSRDWLREHKQNPDKAGGIEITNSENFVLWATTDQPMMVLHELAHAYHSRVLGEGYSPIEAAYQNAIERQLYANVDYVHGGKKRAYAVNNKEEFFAELTEAYLGCNDFFPFDKQDLRSHDPIGYALMKNIWGERSDEVRSLCVKGP
jgi:hypothetical protein